MIHLITGCMGSGKSERLIELADQVPDDRKLILANTKYAGNYMPAKFIESRNGRKLQCDTVPFFKIEKQHTHIFIDEGQWITEFRIRDAKEYSEEGLNFYVSLLDRTYTGKYYDTFLAWEAVADEITVMHGVCAVTGGKAEYSELLTDKESVRKEDYRAVCWEVFRQSKHCRIVTNP